MYNDSLSLKIIIKIGIPVLIVVGYWLYGYIKGLTENNAKLGIDPEKDVKYYSKKIKSEPDNYQNYYERGTASLKLYDYESALNDLTKSIKLNDRYFEAYANRGAVYYALG